MVVTNSQSKIVSLILQQIVSDYPDIKFEIAQTTHWQPDYNTIFYDSSNKNVIWSLLHELGHMKAEHKNYGYDLELLIMESEAWEKAVTLAKKYGVIIDKDHIEDCLDTYRNWLHKRSSCPSCEMTSSQNDSGMYICINCSQEWKVSKSRFCRSYRIKN